MTASSARNEALSILLVTIMLLAGCGRHEPATTDTTATTSAIESPLSITEITDHLNELDSMSSKAISSAMSNALWLPDYAIQASSSSDYSEAFSEAKLFQLPASISVTSGRPGNGWVRVRLQTGDAAEISCAYAGNGSSSTSGTSCGSNGNAYQFSFCMSSSQFDACTASSSAASACMSSSSINLGISAGETVTANSIRLQVVSGDSCVPTRVQMTLGKTSPVCGGTSISKTHFLGNISCPQTTGIGLRIFGNSIGLNGRGFSFSAPSSIIGLLIQGESNLIQRVNVSGVTTGFGVLAYDSDKSTFQNNTASGNAVGLYVYSESAETSDIKVISNDLRANQLIGLRVAGAYATNNLTFTGNRMDGTAGFAAALYTKNTKIMDSQLNTVTGSGNGYYLVGGNVELTGLNLSQSGIPGNQVLVVNATGVTVNRLNVSYTASPNGSDTRVGLHIYNSTNVNISELTASGSDVGLKLAIENGVQMTANVNNSRLTGARVAGVMIQSYDSTRFGSVSIQNCTLSQNPSGRQIWVNPNTQIGSANFSNNAL